MINDLWRGSLVRADAVLYTYKCGILPITHYNEDVRTKTPNKEILVEIKNCDMIPRILADFGWVAMHLIG